MKPDSWLFIIMRSLGKVWAFRVEKRTFIILGCGGVIFAGALAFFAYGYFSLLYERSYLDDESKRLKYQISMMEQKLKELSLEKVPLKPTPPPVAIQDLKMSRNLKRGGFSVNFRLINQNPQQAPISGTLAMVAKNETLRVPLYRVLPEMRLDKGIPQQPEKGSEFQVKRQKFVEAFFDSSPEEVFKTLTIYVYSPKGKLILQKSAEIPEK